MEKYKIREMLVYDMWLPKIAMINFTSNIKLASSVDETDFLILTFNCFQFPFIYIKKCTRNKVHMF